ncbi:putative endoglucanase type K [Apiospora phragmitis]|uniref:Cellulase n=1 Tax=Apiospora phragmitis TaxID=2905665 RepID=A0ABR1TQ36_9PEZI
MHAPTLLSLLTAASTASALSGSGRSTRYWDCCKTSCAWSGKAAVSQPVTTCDNNNSPVANADAPSGCDGGAAFACANNSPWAVNDDVAYGFAATAIAAESATCCACFKYVLLTFLSPFLPSSSSIKASQFLPSVLFHSTRITNPSRITFTSGPVSGKTMVVQSTNTGGDLGSNQFDLMMPGGGVGLFDGCTRQYGQALPGQQYGGISSRSECASFPSQLRAGCEWRFDWFQNADNPNFNFEQVQCPSELVARSNCHRNDDSSFPAFNA